MDARSRRIILATVASGLLFGAAFLGGSSGAQAAACDPTINPAADYSWTGLTWDTDQAIAANFTAARAAEGCPTPMVLPAGFDSMTPQAQMLWLFNNEREARGETDLTLDSTLMSQVALNHSKEMATYGYFEHTSPINALGLGQVGVDVPRQEVNPVFATNYFFGENLAGTFANAAEATFAYMYVDASEGWGHRGAILQGGFQWVGIGIYNGPKGPLYTDDFESYVGFVPAGSSPPTYTPPATADTNPPAIANVSYANGTATASGVADSPLNVNDTGATPTTAAVTGVVFYTNNIVDNQGTFNTVAGTQTAPGSGTWTAPITVNPGDVLHAVAVDGSGNFVDVTPAPPAVALAAGANTVALPAATATASASSVNATAAAAQTPAVTPTAAAVAKSIDRQARHDVVRYVRVFVGGRWKTYDPGGSGNFNLYADEGVVVKLSSAVRWHVTQARQRFVPMRVHLHPGWNFVAVPYPYTGMTCHAVRLELARAGDRLEQITVGPATDVGVIMRPDKAGSWGNDKTMQIPYSKGFWIKDTGTATWIPSPVNYTAAVSAIK